MDAVNYSNARKKIVPFGDADEYYAFIATQLQNVLAREYYSVVAAQPIETNDGTMLRLHLNSEVENGEREVAAECAINNQTWFIFRDCLWAVAHMDGMAAQIPITNDNKTAGRNFYVIVYKASDLLR